MIPAMSPFSLVSEYRPQAEDTSVETDKLTFHLLRHALSECSFSVPSVVKLGRMKTLQITDMESISRADLLITGIE